VLRWEFDQAVKRGANQTLRHSATALPADQYVWQSDRKNKLRPPGTRESLPACQQLCIPVTLIVLVITRQATLNRLAGKSDS
jgi:hypothetical protein